MRIGRTFAFLALLLAFLVVTGGEPQQEADAAFPGENGRIAFQRQSGSAYHIWTMNPDGSDQQSLTEGKLEDAQSPRWSPDGTRIVFAGVDDEGWGIFIMTADGEDITRLELPAEFAASPSWSPDGSEIIYEGLDEFFTPGIFIIGVDGTNNRRFSEGGGLPAWAPSGDRIAFLRTNPVPQIVVASPEGDDPTIVAEGGIAFLEPPDVPFEVELITVWAPTWSPDGETLMYGEYDATSKTYGLRKVTPAGANLGYIPNAGPGASFSPDGEQIVFADWPTRNPDPQIRVVPAGGGTAIAVAAGLNPDWGPVPSPPIVFLHGFLGAEIVCGTDVLWPAVPPGFSQMELAADGLGPATGACEATVGETIDSFLSKGVYDTTMEYLEEEFPGRAHFFAWDWRKGTGASLTLLDEFIDDVLAESGASSVVLMAHSYGGLLASNYIASPVGADKVARVLTIGTPALGAPKALFPLFAGIETPGGLLGLDAIMAPNSAVQAFARNLHGNYYLFPSPAYGPWLTILPGAQLNGQGVLDYVAGLGGNPALLEEAWARHTAIFDPVPPGEVDFQVIVGTGLLTIGGVRVDPNGFVILDYENGDGTVPARSAARGLPGLGNPNAGNTRYSCGVGHVPLPGDPQVTDAITNYLRFGGAISGLGATPCPASGKEIRIFSLKALNESAQVQSSSNPLTPDEAEGLGLVEHMVFENEQFIIASGDLPPVVLPPAEFIEITPVGSNGVKGRTLRYGPLTGEVVVSVTGGVVLVLDDGQPVQGTPTGGGAPSDRTWGDLDCNGVVDARDAMLAVPRNRLRPVDREPGCPSFRTVVEAGGATARWGDVNWSGGQANTADANAILRYLKGSAKPVTGCPAIGSVVTVLEIPGPGAGPERTWADLNCDGRVDLGDATAISRFRSGQPLKQPPGCPALGATVTAGSATVRWGDVNCSGGAPDPGDVNAIRRAVMGAVVAAAGCPAIGSKVAVQET